MTDPESAAVQAEIDAILAEQAAQGYRGERVDCEGRWAPPLPPYYVNAVQGGTLARCSVCQRLVGVDDEDQVVAHYRGNVGERKRP